MKISENLEVWTDNLETLIKEADKIINKFPNDKLDYSDFEVEHRSDCFGAEFFELCYYRSETEVEKVKRLENEKIRLDQEKNKRYEQYKKLRKEFETKE